MTKRSSAWFERLLFSIMGPAQVGDPGAPVRALPEGPPEICASCQQPVLEHEVVRSPRLTYTRCPGEPS